LDQGIAPSRIAFAGDSAGGSLAVTTILRARERGLPLPAATMPLSPQVDLDGTGGTWVSNRERDMLVKRELSLGLVTIFLGEGGDRRDPFASPTHGDLRGLPPVYIQVGDHETLLDDSHTLAVALRRAGVEVKIDVFPEMQHVFHFLAGTAPEADEAIGQLAAWVRPKLGLE